MGNLRKKKHAVRCCAALFCVLFAVFCSGCGADIASPQQEEEEKLPQIIVGMSNYEPYAFMNDGGEMTGVDVELATEAFRRIGYEPVFQKIIWEERKEQVADGTVDCLWCCLTMPEDTSDSKYQWAGPSLYSRQMFIVRADSQVDAISDLEDLCVAVQAGTEPETLLLQSEEASAPNPRRVYTYPGMNEVYASLRKGYVDAICGYENAVKMFVETAPTEYRMLEKSLCTSALGVAFAERIDASVVAAVNDALADMRADGTTREIAEHYGLNWIEEAE